jgi:D-alanyl-D-alanine dipeptidase
MKLRVLVRALLFRLGINALLPVTYTRSMIVKENNEEFVDITNDKELFFEDSLERPIVMRRQIYERLCKAREKLPQGLYFKIYFAYRPRRIQIKQWEKNYKITKERNPDLPEEKIVWLTGIKVANPFKGYSGHQTGGAIDLTLYNEKGGELNLGTKFDEFNEEKTKSKSLTEEERENRKILYKAMISAGFVNYPAEWWHYCYGDRMWAAYSGRKSCFYGFLDEKDLKIIDYTELKKS